MNSASFYILLKGSTFTKTLVFTMYKNLLITEGRVNILTYLQAMCFKKHKCMYISFAILAQEQIGLNSKRKCVCLVLG